MKQKKERIGFLDDTRGLLVILMVFYHAFYTGGSLFGWRFCQQLYYFFMPSEEWFAGLFILICGICCHLSHNNVKRGLLLAGISILLSLVLWIFMPDNMIWFGILHFLSIAILLFALLSKPLSYIPPLWGLVGCALLGFLTWHLPFDCGYYIGIPHLLEIPIPRELLYQPWLFPLGLGFADSADYFPLFPWIFVFLFGTFLGRYIKEEKYPVFMKKSYCKPLSIIGQWALPIYVIHQPILFGLFWIIDKLH